MTYKIRNIGIGAVMTLIVIAAFSLFYVAKANPSFFIRGQSASATTTVVFMTAGTATTTLTLDGGAGAAQGADTAALLIQFAGSSTAAVLNADIEYSQDNVDWYAIGFAGGSETTSASSSPSIGNVQQFTFPFASSTVTRAAVGTATSTRIVRLPMPTRWIRAVFTLPAGSTNGSVWAEFVAKRQAN